MHMHMSTYTEFTDTVAQQWEGSLKQLQDLQAGLLAPWIRNTTRLVPDVDVPFADRLPSQKDVVEASFHLAERALEAQRAYVVGLVDAITSAAQPAETGSEKTPNSSKK